MYYHKIVIFHLYRRYFTLFVYLNFSFEVVSTVNRDLPEFLHIIMVVVFQQSFPIWEVQIAVLSHLACRALGFNVVSHHLLDDCLRSTHTRLLKCFSQFHVFNQSVLWFCPYPSSTCCISASFHFRMIMDRCTVMNILCCCTSELNFSFSNCFVSQLVFNMHASEWFQSAIFFRRKFRWGLIKKSCFVSAKPCLIVKF